MPDICKKLNGKFTLQLFLFPMGCAFSQRVYISISQSVVITLQRRREDLHIFWRFSDGSSKPHNQRWAPVWKLFGNI